jgi:hypothetical protein
MLTVKASNLDHNLAGCGLELVEDKLFPLLSEAELSKLVLCVDADFREWRGDSRVLVEPRSGDRP